MLGDWEARDPGRIKSIMAAMQAVTPSHLMARSIFPFETIRATGEPAPDGDIAFDDAPLATPVGRIDVRAGSTREEESTP